TFCALTLTIFGEGTSTGCIPLIIMDNTTEIFEEILPFEKFTVRVLEKDIPQLPAILDAIVAEPGRLEAMQKELSCVHQARATH
ncbi:hypothetical protein CYMTET_31278, partial [Cymbomonas tetramitiformis]